MHPDRLRLLRKAFEQGKSSSDALRVMVFVLNRCGKETFLNDLDTSEKGKKGRTSCEPSSYKREAIIARISDGRRVMDICSMSCKFNYVRASCFGLVGGCGCAQLVCLIPVLVAILFLVTRRGLTIMTMMIFRRNYTPIREW